MWFSAPSFWMGGTVHTTYAAALKTTTHPKKLGAENRMLQLNI